MILVAAPIRGKLVVVSLYNPKLYVKQTLCFRLATCTVEAKVIAELFSCRANKVTCSNSASKTRLDICQRDVGAVDLSKTVIQTGEICAGDKRKVG